MGFVSRLKDRSAGRKIAGTWIFLFAVFLTPFLVGNAHAQCVDHLDKKTALKFSNESRFKLTFFVDDDEKGVVVPSKAVSGEISVEPGEHLLSARAIVKGNSFWVWVVNDVPPGQICTWTIGDPPGKPEAHGNKYRIVIESGLNEKYGARAIALKDLSVLESKRQTKEKKQ